VSLLDGELTCDGCGLHFDVTGRVAPIVPDGFWELKTQRSFWIFCSARCVAAYCVKKIVGTRLSRDPDLEKHARAEVALAAQRLAGVNRRK
jgi:hypothetical protein